MERGYNSLLYLNCFIQDSLQLRITKNEDKSEFLKSKKALFYSLIPEN